MKIVITGGHLSPALAVIEELPKGVDVVFVGRKHAFEGDTALSLEYREITSRNIPFFILPTGRLQRVFTLQTFPSLLKVPRGIGKAFSLLKREKPDCVLSFGGYVGLPVVIAAHFLKIPVVIHEQTLRVGFSNRLASRFAKKICISWRESEHLFPKEKTVLTGNPLRKSFLSIKHTKKKIYEKPMIYITGGSGGSHEVNMIVEGYLETLLSTYVLVHQTGDTKTYNDYEKLLQKRDSFDKNLQKRYHLYTFMSPDEAASCMRDAELVISRAGINTITELLYLKKKAYLIPLRSGQKGEQSTNAAFFTKLGLGEIYSSNQNFTEIVQKMISSSSYTLKTDIDVSRIEKAASHLVSILTHEAQNT